MCIFKLLFLLVATFGHVRSRVLDGQGLKGSHGVEKCGILTWMGKDGVRLIYYLVLYRRRRFQGSVRTEGGRACW